MSLLNAGRMFLLPAGLVKFATLGFMFLGQLVDILLIATQVGGHLVHRCLVFFFSWWTSSASLFSSSSVVVEHLAHHCLLLRLVGI